MLAILKTVIQFFMLLRLRIGIKLRRKKYQHGVIIIIIQKMGKFVVSYIIGTLLMTQEGLPLMVGKYLLTMILIF